MDDILDYVRKNLARMMPTSTKNYACVSVCGRKLSIELLEPEKGGQTLSAASPAGSASVSFAEVSDFCDDGEHVDVKDDDSDESFDANEYFSANETNSESEEDQFASLVAEKMEELKSYLMDRVVPDTDFDEDQPITSADILGINQMEEMPFDGEQMVDRLVSGWSCHIYEVDGRKRAQVDYIPPEGFAPIDARARSHYTSKPEVVGVEITLAPLLHPLAMHASFHQCIQFISAITTHQSIQFFHIRAVQARALGVPTAKRKAKKKRTLGKLVDDFVRHLHHEYGMSTGAMDSFCLAVQQLKKKQTTVVGGWRLARTALLPECKHLYTRWKLSDKLQDLRIFRISEKQFIVVSKNDGVCDCAK